MSWAGEESSTPSAQPRCPPALLCIKDLSTIDPDRNNVLGSPERELQFVFKGSKGGMVTKAVSTSPISTDSSGTTAGGRDPGLLGLAAESTSASSMSKRCRRGAPIKPLARPLQQPIAFKAAIYAKGWSLKALAERWGVTLDGLLKLARDENRSLHFDDAVCGLKKIGPPIKLRKDWRAILAGEQPPPKPRKPGLRYRGYLMVGAVVAAIKAVGSIAEQGMHGIVVQVIVDRTQEIYRVLFETGELEIFTPVQVDEYLQDVGLQREELMQYRYVDDATVGRDFEDGLFVFG